VQSIFRKIDPSSRLVFGVGLFSAALQCVFLREYLSVFSGNEFIIGLILSIWLLAMGSGSMAGQKADRINAGRLALLAIILACSGILGIRAGKLFFSPGELIGPLPACALMVLTEAPLSYMLGFIFGHASKASLKSKNPYGYESLGALIGSFMTFACVALYCNNIVIVFCASIAFVVVFHGRKRYCIAAIAVMLVLTFFNDRSMHWKYRFPFSKILFCREGEIAAIQGAGDTTFMLNGSVYKSTLEKPFIEQAVHVPLAQRANPRRALVIFDKGQSVELAKYNGLQTDRIESEPRIASPGSIICAPETFRTSIRYDAILLGAGMPQTAAASRFYTVSFFKRMRSLLSDSGVFSFTLPFNEDYMGPREKKLYDVLYCTMHKAFSSVAIFPGIASTFMGSNTPFPRDFVPRVETRYLNSQIIPAVTVEQKAEANMQPDFSLVNTVNRPVGLVLGMELWTGLFKNAVLILGTIFGLLFVSSMIMLPKTRAVFSMYGTGFTVGVYSVLVLLLYQSTYGLLYSRISLLLITLTGGIFLGTLVKGLRHPDLAIGFYSVITLAALAWVPTAPAILFYCCNLGIGLLCGAQFVSNKIPSAGALYAADVFGGALGMALCSTVLAPFFGVLATAIGLCILKIALWSFLWKRPL
jgi:spermidine synthase